MLLVLVCLIFTSRFLLKDTQEHDIIAHQISILLTARARVGAQDSLYKCKLSKKDAPPFSFKCTMSLYCLCIVGRGT